MKCSLSWLKTHLETSASLEEICTTLNQLGLVVDHVDNPGLSLKGFKIVEVLSAEPHTDADKLRVCQVNTGKETLQIVCAAPNARAGIKAVLGLAGMTVPSNGMVLKVSKIRGVESHGMMCSLVELGLSDTHEGTIIELPQDAPVGLDYVQYAGLDDPILDIEVTPNRGDCLGVLGIARDLAATGIGTLKDIPLTAIKGTFDSPVSLTLDFDQDHQDACPVFYGRVIKGVKNGPSPAWLQKMLKSVGLKSISALVDVTNYMSHNFGRPMHVFDVAKLQGNLCVRMGRSKETLKTLDDKTYILDASMIVIADESGPVSLGGAMGGLDSSVTSETTTVFLESAYFEAIHVINGGRTLNINTESRYRFERGVDPMMVAPVLELATQMILDLCGGAASHVVKAGTEPDTTRLIDFDPAMVKDFGSVTLPKARILEILTHLGMTYEGTGDTIQVTTPSWRHDLAIPEDLVEEVLRVEGYDSIILQDMPKPRLEEVYESTERLSPFASSLNSARKLLASRGMDEIQTWSFVSRKTADFFGTVDDRLVIRNPISMDLEIMRPTLLGNLVEAASTSIAKGLPDGGFFEIGNQFQGHLKDFQELSLCGVRFGSQVPREWLSKERSCDVFDIKADCFATLDLLGIKGEKVQITQEDTPVGYHPGRCGVIKQGPKNIIGVFGQIHPTLLKHWDCSGSVMGFEIFLERLPNSRNGSKAYEAYNLHPLVRDFAFVVDQGVPSQKIVQAVRKANQELITRVSVFDVYQGPNIPEGKKSFALTAHIQPRDKTLVEQDLQQLMDQVVQSVLNETGGVLRS